MKVQTDVSVNPEKGNSTKPLLPLVVGGLTEEAIGIIARKKALEYSYHNEYQYLKFVNAIIDGFSLALNEINNEKIKMLNGMLEMAKYQETIDLINYEINYINGKVI
jgi:hypothetical protein